jgi:hypothetical protein
MGEFELGRGKITAGKGNLRFRHGCSPLLLVFLPYPKAKRMSAKNAVMQKYFMSRVPRRSWMTRIAGINRRNFAGSLPTR